MIYCWSAIVSIAISRTTFELFDVEKHRDFEIWVNGHSRSLKMVPFQKPGYGFLFAFCSNYGRIVYRFRDQVRRWSKKIAIFIPPAFSVGILP